MAHIQVEGILGLDGSYPFDGAFTNRDFREIKRMTGLRAGEVQEALEAGDTDVIVAIAAICIRRNSVELNEDQLWDAEVGLITFVADEDEVDVDPPAQESSPSDDDAKPSSGDDSSTSSEHSPQSEAQNASGHLHSVTGAVSVRSTSRE